MQNKKHGAAMGVAVLATCAAASLNARADVAEPVLEEVTVTATKTGAIAAQSAPFTLQAIGQDAIANGQMQGFDDYSKLIPGLAALNKGPDQTQIMIRGVSAGRVSHAEPQNQSTSGLYIDEMPVATNAFNPDLDLFDVNRIEVLKGPQGSLYGAGAMSGAIRVITNDVDLTTIHGAAAATGSSVDHGSAGYSAHVMINAPVVDGTFGVRATAYYDHEGGFINNVIGRDDYNGYSTIGARLKGAWKANDALTVRASVIYQKLTSDGRPQMFSSADPAVTAIAAPGESFAVTQDYQTAKFVRDPFDDRFVLGNLLAEYQLDNGIQLVSSTSYQNRLIHNQLDDTYRIRQKFGPAQVDGITPLAATFVNDSNLNALAQELRASQKLDSGLSWIAGVYYEHHDIHFVQSDITPGLDALAVSYGLPPAAGFGAEANSVFDGNEADSQQQFAGFGELTIPLAPRWDFIAGLRLFHYKQNSQSGVNPAHSQGSRAADAAPVTSPAPMASTSTSPPRSTIPMYLPTTRSAGNRSGWIAGCNSMAPSTRRIGRTRRPNSTTRSSWAIWDLLLTAPAIGSKASRSNWSRGRSRA